MKRILSLIFVLLMVFCAVVGCNKQENKKTNIFFNKQTEKQSEKESESGSAWDNWNENHLNNNWNNNATVNNSNNNSSINNNINNNIDNNIDNSNNDNNYNDSYDNNDDFNDNNGDDEVIIPSYPNESSVGLEFELNDDQASYTLTGLGTCTETEVVIDKHNGLPVTKIASYVFYHSCQIVSVTLGESVERIGSYAFSSCDKLVEVINKSKLVLEKGSNAYGSVAQYALKIHEGESEIVHQGEYIFYTYKENNYLLGYTGDNIDIVLPDYYNGKTYEIYESAFNSLNIRSVTIGNGATRIDDWCFAYCYDLIRLVIPVSVKIIGEEVFHWSDNIEEIKYRGTEEDWNEISINSYWDENYVIITYGYNGK